MDNKKAFQSRTNRQIAPSREQTEWQTHTTEKIISLQATYAGGKHVGTDREAGTERL